MGFDSKLFVKQPVSESLKCKHCSHIYSECVETESKKYCKSCAIELGIQNFTLNDKMNHIVQMMQVYCKNKRMNCPWIGKLSELPVHLATCRFKPQKCQNPSCPFVGSSDLLETHSKTCLYRECVHCHRLFKDSPLSKQFSELSFENKTLREKIETLTEELFLFKMENDKLLEENEVHNMRIKQLQEQIDLLEISFQDRIQLLLQEKDMNSLGEFMDENFDILKEQFVEDNVRLNKEIKELKRSNEALIFENLKLKDGRESIEMFREKIIELEKQNLILKTNENYKELSKKLITKCDLLTEQNQLLQNEMRNLTGISKQNFKEEIKEDKDEKLDVTKGVISDLYNGVIKSNPIVQVMQKFQKYVSNGKERYKIWISDGVNSYPAITGTAPSEYISEGTLTPFSIVRIIECVKDTKSEVLMITDLEILDNKCTSIIGNPVRIDSKLFVWKILRSEIVNLKFSPVFIIKGMSWKLQICYSKKSLGFLLYPVNLKGGNELKIEFNFMIMNPNNSNHYHGAGGKWHTFTAESQGTGFSSFIRNNELEQFFRDDAINVAVTITAMEEKDLTEIVKKE